MGFFRGIGSDHSRPGRSGLTAPLPVASPREAELRSGWLLSAVRGWWWRAAARHRLDQNIAAFVRCISNCSKNPRRPTHAHYQPVDQPGFSAEFSKWFSKLRHCTFAPTVRCNDDKSENYHLQTVSLVYSLDPGLFLLILFPRPCVIRRSAGWLERNPIRPKNK